MGKKFPSFEVRGDQRTHSLARSFVVNLSLFEMKAEIFQNLNKAMANIYLPREFPACHLEVRGDKRTNTLCGQFKLLEMEGEGDSVQWSVKNIFSSAVEC